MAGHIYGFNVGPFPVSTRLGNCTLGEDAWLKFIIYELFIGNFRSAHFFLIQLPSLTRE